ncbi:iron-containing redox enzyme family protein [Longispora sp. NPDC051575]|uniref:iron-containing redox enzyme family protein n=1 Tax=Longispora sp. NPDC051575 TaxID=3154943 RepID=UPI0034182096
MRLPTARGPLSGALLTTLGSAPGTHRRGWPAVDSAEPLTDEDLQLALFVCYELHYRGWDDVAEDWEWDPVVLTLRARLEAPFEAALRAEAGTQPPVTPTGLADRLTALVGTSRGPSLAGYMQRHATLGEFREFVAHRSVYHLREADPHSWAIPRLDGRPKAALIEIQADEYGGGRLERMHSELFRTTMDQLALDSTYGAHVDAAPAVTLAHSNVMSLLGLHRRLRGAALGHLAAFEMTSSMANRRYGNGLRRLGGGPVATRFYDEHVEADAVHEQIAVHDLCVAFAEREPHLGGDVLFGAACAQIAGSVTATHLLDHWKAGRTSLLHALPPCPDDLLGAAA